MSGRSFQQQNLRAAGRPTPGRRRSLIRVRFASPRHARGYTLLELLLVIGIVMICAGAVAPSVVGLLSNYHLKEGAEMVRCALAGTRVHAVDVCSTYEFRFEVNGRHFLALPTDNDVLNSTGSAVSADGRSLAPSVIESGQLPEKMSFQETPPAAGTQPTTPPVPAGSDPGWIGGLGRMQNGHDFASATWSAPIYFRPDGTGSDATFNIVGENGSGFHFTIRALTGEIFIHGLETEPKR